MSEVELREEVQRLREQLDAVTQIGIALSAERDLPTLLGTVLSKARWLTHSDAGSLYLVEGERREKLRFALAQNDSLEVPFVEMVLDVQSRTIVGHAVRSREILNLPDVYDLPQGVEYGFSTKFDESVGYRCKSMLVVPMIDHRDRVIGCLQLINRKPHRGDILESPAHAEQVVQTYSAEAVELISSIASQAAVAIDKARLVESLEETLDGMVHASVVAIESRDPTTSGHSERVATLSVAMAKAVSDLEVGKFCGVRFSDAQVKELHYASLLHDFGKVGVREQVLVKAKKLFPWDLEQVRLRFALALKERETEALRDLVDRLIRSGRTLDPTVFYEGTESRIREEASRLMDMYRTVCAANEPRVLADGSEQLLNHVAQECYLDLEGRRQPLLTDQELRDLAIPRGSLNREERLEIESHVAHTYRFLARIPWTEELRDLPRIAGAHHEKLDGSGYPHGLEDQEIPVQAKIMSVADIFDALTAWDRPYKKALPLEAALKILDAEAKGNKIEAELVELFRARRLYDLVLNEGRSGPGGG